MPLTPTNVANTIQIHGRLIALSSPRAKLSLRRECSTRRGIVPSMTTLKEQCLYLHRLQNLAEARQIIGEFIACYSGSAIRPLRSPARPCWWRDHDTRSHRGVRSNDRTEGRSLAIRHRRPENRERYSTQQELHGYGKSTWQL